ncbi:MAG: M14 family zinc carboxypeptidase [Verrucomicrobiales bacterium]
MLRLSAFFQGILGALLFGVALVAGHAQENKLVVELGGITFDSNYDNGSLGAMAMIADDRYQGSLFVESGELGERFYWFRFRMTGIAGRSFRMTLDHVENRRPFIRVGGTAWRRMTAAEASSSMQLTLSFSDDENDAEVAFFEPLGLAETYAAVNAISAGSPFFSAEVIGRSFLGNEVMMLKVEDPRYPSVGKHRVWVHSRAHAGEVTSTHTMLGFLRQVLEDSELGRQLREHCIFNFVPILNVDGVVAGHTRWDARGLDPERPWCDVNIPSVQAVKDVVDELMTSATPIEVALNLHSTKGRYADSFFFKHIAPSVTPAFEAIQQRYIDAFDAATPLFDNLSPQTSQLSECLFIESYFWNNWGESVMAITHEGHYGQRVTDGAYLTGADYSEMGRAMAKALVSYFDLPRASEYDLDYATWVALNFTEEQQAAGTATTHSADPDGDGVSNAEEFLVQTDPLSAASMLLPMQVQDGHIVINKAARIADSAVEVHASKDLQSWSRIDVGLAETRVGADGVERGIHSEPLGPDGKRFLRFQMVP